MKAIIFDMDGLMIDTEKFYYKVEKEIASEYGITLDNELLRDLMGMSPKDAGKIFIEKLKINMSLEEFLEKRFAKMEIIYNTELKAMPGLYELLNKFYKKVDLAIATGSPEKFLEIVVDKLSIRKYFKVLQPSDEIKNGKPDPEIFIKTINKLKLKFEDCIILEDSLNGIVAGKRAGCYTIAVPNKYSINNDFSTADYIAKDLFDASIHLEDIIEKDKILI